MFIGHFAVGLAGKRVAPRAPLALLVAAAQLADLLWPILLLAGVERVKIDPGNTAVTPLDFVSYPVSHSLLTLTGFAVLLAAVVFVAFRDRRAALVAGALVVSHWVLDALSHGPDVPLYPGGPKVGLGLWNSIPATMVVELGLFALGVALYLRATRPRDRAGTLALAALVVFLLVIYVANIFGPPPPSEHVLALVALSGWLFLPWAAWIDRHRLTVPAR
jgi:FtsH-binding integral membrane protein